MTNEFLKGTVERIDANLSRVRCADELYDCEIRKKLFRYEPLKTDIAVGDRVRFEKTEENKGVIEEILPRRNKLSRPAPTKDWGEHVIAANIDQLIIVSSTKEPKLNLHLIDRYLVVAEKYDFKAIICINKIDLADETYLMERMKIYERTPYEIIYISAHNGINFQKLKSKLAGMNSIVAGFSGVGKSSIINRIIPHVDIETMEVSKKWKKGRHATTAVTMFHLPFGGYIIDTPGIREFGLWDISRKDLSQLFPDFAPFRNNCKFRNCVHLSEPGCAIRSAVETGILHQNRYESYIAIYDSIPNDKPWE